MPFLPSCAAMAPFFCFLSWLKALVAQRGSRQVVKDACTASETGRLDALCSLRSWTKASCHLAFCTWLGVEAASSRTSCAHGRILQFPHPSGRFPEIVYMIPSKALIPGTASTCLARLCTTAETADHGLSVIMPVRCCEDSSQICLCALFDLTLIRVSAKSANGQG